MSKSSPHKNSVVMNYAFSTYKHGNPAGLRLRRFTALLFAILLAFATAGCSDTGLGAAAGAGGGALVGSAVGHPWIGALVGGAGGAVAGHEIGKSQNKNRDQSDQE
ncbi:MAG: YMGG-like glycine zipper-containing protein [Candidatus Binataceae bacterium]